MFFRVPLRFPFRVYLCVYLKIWGIYPHRVQGFRGRGWGYVAKILKKLRQRRKIKEVLQEILEGEHLEQKQKGYHLPGVYQMGKKIPPRPDYYERGI